MVTSLTVSVPTRLADVVPDRDRSCDHYFVYYRLWSHVRCFMQAIIGHCPGKSVYLKELSHVIVSKQAFQPRTHPYLYILRAFYYNDPR